MWHVNPGQHRRFSDLVHICKKSVIMCRLVHCERFYIYHSNCIDKQTTEVKRKTKHYNRKDYLPLTAHHFPTLDCRSVVIYVNIANRNEIIIMKTPMNKCIFHSTQCMQPSHTNRIDILQDTLIEPFCPWMKGLLSQLTLVFPRNFSGHQAITLQQVTLSTSPEQKW